MIMDEWMVRVIVYMLLIWTVCIMTWYSDTEYQLLSSENNYYNSVCGNAMRTCAILWCVCIYILLKRRFVTWRWKDKKTTCIIETLFKPLILSWYFFPFLQVELAHHEHLEPYVWMRQIPCQLLVQYQIQDPSESKDKW